MKLKTKIILIVISCFLFIGCVILYGFLMYQKGWNACERNAVPMPDEPKQRIDQIGDKPCSLTSEDLRYYDTALSVVIRASGAGMGKLIIPRPRKWLPPTPKKNLLLIGLGGGYSCEHWLPGGSVAYLRRIGGFKNINFYFGPGLSVAALDRYPVTEYIDIKIYLQVAATW